jgi:ankyrin repeat protein
MTRRLPARPSLAHLKKQAKRVLQGLIEKNPEALERYRALLSRPAPEHPQLADAQRGLAREYGFASWARLKAHVEAVEQDADPAAQLTAAVKANDVAAARRVFTRHPEIKARINEALPGGAFGTTPLLAALPFGNREMIDLILEQGADINQKSHWWAGGFGVLDNDHGLVEFLIARGARVDAYAAARHGMMDRLDALVSADPEAVHMRGGDGQTPLHVASSVEVAAYLLDHGADIDARDVDHESTPAQYMVRDRQDVARYLVARGARTDLLMVAALGDLERVRHHLDADPGSIRLTVSDRWFPKRDPRSGGSIYIWTLGPNKSPHVIAREFGHEDVLRLLLERSTPEMKLALACEIGDETLFRALLAARPDLAKTLTADEAHKLVFAAQANNTAAVRLMLTAGWPLDVRGQHGGTPLHWAAWHGNAGMVRELLRHQAPPNVRDADHDQTPVGWALHGSENSWHREHGDYAATLTALLEAGATPPALTPDLDASEPVLEVLRRFTS